MPFDNFNFPLPSQGETECEDEIVRTLRRAADEIRRRGLTKGRQCDVDGRVCLHGAIAVAVGGRMDRKNGYVSRDSYQQQALYREAGAVALHYLNTHLKADQLFGCAEWNNAPERTAAEVIAALEGAADSRAKALMAGER